MPSDIIERLKASA